MNQLGYNFCPHCSGRLGLREIKDGEPERLVCEACGFIFYQGPKLVAATIFELDGGILLTQRAIEPGYGKWTFPGGFVERGERAETAAEREALEEAGVRSKPARSSVFTLTRIRCRLSRSSQGRSRAGSRSPSTRRWPWRFPPRRTTLDRDGFPEHRAGAEGLPAQVLAPAARGESLFPRPPISLPRRRAARHPAPLRRRP
jgi:8-oxo-dGTP pyrophosphatase MutT (NUDIX family)